ncbi:cytochrome c3 family protein [Prolixibacteraceae bacterium Z1-6]|uniref:Cytochrome c3 family protein n=1 Tax=Draconibacterium aestuarii TaxID=2998507 RepID=A0A9X3J8T3_9BACT|nr:cytochrome c3 family protein [Prolixibacteraceae bacterium Z1-6]
MIGINTVARAQYYNDAQNHACLKCHSNQSYKFHNSLLETEEKKLMNPYYIIDTTALKLGVHNQFDCTDCHSYDYTTYPHNAELKLEPLGTCLDCHGGDESFARYQFEVIDEEFRKSVHYQLYEDNFTCAKCHSQHTYASTTRISDDVLKIVEYSNNMCLSCHNDMKRYEMVSGHENPKIVQIHEWLPNQELHFEHVRCIECHTQVTDSLLVSHNIVGKEQAVRNCVECHTANSRLKASLYKYQNLQQRSENGMLSTVISNDSYVIGANQVPLLNWLSKLIFILTLAGIIIHTVFRILKK